MDYNKFNIKGYWRKAPLLMEKNKNKALIIVCIISATTGYLWQLFEYRVAFWELFGDEFRARFYFIHQEAAWVGVWGLVYLYSQPKGWMKAFQQGFISLTFGGLIDTIFKNENNWFTLLAVVVFIAYTYGQRKKEVLARRRTGGGPG